MNKKIKEQCLVILNRKLYNEKYIKNNFSELYNKVIEYNLNNNSWLNKLYDFIYQIKNPPACKYCEKPLKFKNKISIGYGIYCSKKCVSLATREKVKQTNLERYGVEYPMKNLKILNKLRQTNLERYGVESTLSDVNTQQKIKETNLEKFGVDNPSKSIIIREKVRQTNLKKFGVDNYSKTNEFKDKIKKSVINRSNSEKLILVNKIKQTNLERYGVTTTLILEENRNKLKERNLEKYGVEYPLQNFEIKNKSKKTINERYGCNNISQSQHYKDKISNRIISKWSNILDININDIQYNDGYFKINNYCVKHKLFKIKYDDLYNRIHLGCNNICTKCNPINKQSKIKENELNDFLSTLNLNYQKNNRKILNGMEIDFYFLDYKIGIEFNGLYWHSNKFTDKKYHLNKTKECENQDIHLLHVFEDEWIFKKEIVKSIIKSKLGIIDNKIYGRKTEIREIIDNKLIRNFLETNHIQGFVGSSVKIGLFYENELVSLMTFGKKRISMGNKSSEDGEYEMLRFCNKLNTQVIGGASKLFKYFINNYNPKSILTFADRRYSNGNLYKQLGFKFEKNTKPNYWYFKKNKMIRYHRFNFRKDKLIKEGFDSNKSEFEIMSEKGYLRIYDSGNMKFIYK